MKLVKQIKKINENQTIFFDIQVVMIFKKKRIKDTT